MTEPHRFHPEWVIPGDRTPGLVSLDSDTKGPCRICGLPELATVHRWQLRVRRPLTPEQVTEHAARLRALINHREEPPCPDEPSSMTPTPSISAPSSPGPG